MAQSVPGAHLLRGSGCLRHVGTLRRWRAACKPAPRAPEADRERRGVDASGALAGH